MIRIIKLISKFPPGFMYIISDLMYLIGYRLLRYRAAIVYNNLRNSFPKKATREIRMIRNAFYHSFFDFVVETLMAVSMDEKRIRECVTFKNPEWVRELLDEGSVILLGSHLFSWELQGMAISQIFENKGFYSYQKLKNDSFDRLMINVRGKFGAVGVRRHEMPQVVFKNRKEKAIFYILADQAPVGKAKRFWAPFLNQPTAFYHGIGKIAGLGGFPVIGCYPKRLRRGKYEVEFRLISKGSAEEEKDSILQLYIEQLEQEIQKQPQNWLWTHKRWKTKPRKEDEVSDTLKMELS